ncbi:MAG: hypothetical protein Fur0042_25420 [Cyanophyceae cyanobacterium]
MRELLGSVMGDGSGREAMGGGLAPMGGGRAPSAAQDRTQAETLELLEWGRLCDRVAAFAATALGAIAARRLRIPTERLETERLLAQTREVTDLERRSASALNFGGVRDIGGSLERAERQGVLSGEELLDIATTLAAARNLRRAIAEHEDLVVLNGLIEPLRTLPDLEREIHHCIDDRGRVADRASEKLGSLRDALRQVRDGIQQKLQNIIQQQSHAVQEPTITIRSDRYTLPVKAEHKGTIRGIVHDASASGATLYIEPHSTVEANNRLRQLHRQEAAEEEAVRRRLTQEVAEVLPDLELLLAIVTTLDLAVARSRYSGWLGANAPRFVEAHEAVTLRQLRHPLLVDQAARSGETVIPIDVTVAPQTRVVAITGPNTGGKTVSLKTLGLAALMAKAGLFVPAREPVELPWFDWVLADIGDEQSIEQNLSTFSGHVRRIVRILTVIEAKPPLIAPAATAEVEPISRDRQSPETPLEPLDVDAIGDRLATLSQDGDEWGLCPDRAPAANGSQARSQSAPFSNALILLDEVGAGTDPAEGSALAEALLLALADRARLTVATTHYGELKTLKYRDDRFENASVEFDDTTLRPTYRLLWGIPGRSNALTIARRLGLDQGILQIASDRVGGGSEDINRTIAGLEAERRRQEAKANEVSHLLERAEHLHAQIDRKAKDLKEREEKLRLDQEAAVRSAIGDARKEIARTIRQLQRGTPTGQDAQRATAAINAIAAQFLPSQQPQPAKPTYCPVVGERVRIPKLASKGEVLSIDPDARQLVIRMGLMKTTVSMADIESLDGQTVPPPPPKVPKPPVAVVQRERTTVRTSSNTLDIRGYRVVDAEPEIEQAIAKAIAADSAALWILHGKGTGKLREGVWAFLQTQPLVERYENAAQNDGGTGVTIAYLK